MHSFIGTSWLAAVISCKSCYPFAVSCLAVPEGPTPWWLIQSVIVVAVLCIHPSDRCFNLGVIYSKWFWFPVWLEEVNIECPRPVLKHSFLCDETMMAALSSPLVRNVHCAFIGSQRFIIMIRYWKMIRIPAGEKKKIDGSPRCSILLIEKMLSLISWWAQIYFYSQLNCIFRYLHFSWIFNTSECGKGFFFAPSFNLLLSVK